MGDRRKALREKSLSVIANFGRAIKSGACDVLIVCLFCVVWVVWLIFLGWVIKRLLLS
jgi:hypothetical protein